MAGKLRRKSFDCKRIFFSAFLCLLIFIFAFTLVSCNKDEKLTEEEPSNESQEIEVYMQSATFVYDGEPHGLQIVGLTEDMSVEYSGSETFTDAGTYILHCVVKEEGKKNRNLSAILTINKAELDLRDIKFENETFKWDGKARSIYVEGELPSGVTVEYDGNGKKDIGTYTVTATISGSNYKAVSPLVATMTIEENIHTVTFEQENGDKVEVKVTHGESIAKDDIPLVVPKTGYVGSWGETSLDNVTDDLHLVCSYELEHYAIRYFSMGGGTVLEEIVDYTIESGEVALPKAQRKGYEFCGWYGNSSLSGESVSAIPAGSTGEKTFFAKWEIINYTVTYNLDDQTLNATKNINDGDNYVYTVESGTLVLGSPYKYGATFLYWQDEEGHRVDKIEGSLAKDLTLTPVWE